MAPDRGSATSGWSAYALAVAGLGVALFLASLAIHVEEMLDLNDVGGPTLAFLVDGVPALGLVYGAYRLRGSDLDDGGTKTVLGWSLAGLAAFAGATGASVLIRVAEGRVVGEPSFVLLLSATAGSLAGFLGGYNHARARADARSARRASRTLSFVNGVLRHDLRNDLHAIEGATEILATQVDDDRESVGRQIDRIDEKVAASMDLVESAGDIAATLSGDGDLETVDLTRLVEDAVDRVGTDRTTIVTDLPESAPVVGNAGLRSVVENLVENAIEHNDGSDPRIEIRIETDGETTRLRVSDNGPGIPEDRKEQLFQPRESGTHGGGLYLVATLVDSYGGEISVSDNDPTGAVFTVELPASEA